MSKVEEKNNQNNNVKVGKVKYKAEPTRHFPRFKIPAYVEIDGKRYKVRDWSIGGCAIIGLPDEYLEKKWVKANFIIPFDTFDVVIKDIKLEFIRKYPDGSIGCRFTEIKPEQVALLQDIIEAYLEGSIVSLDEFINVVKREDLRAALEANRPLPKKENKRIELIRKVFILGLFSFITFLLIVFILEALKHRVFLIKAVDAFVDADLTVLRSPFSGVIKYNKGIHIDTVVKKGDRIGVVVSPFKLGFILYSPVKGIITTQFAKNREVIREGDPVVGIFPENSEIYVFANILHKDTDRVHLNQIASVELPTGQVLEGKIVEIKSGTNKLLATIHMSTPMPSYAQAWSYDMVKIKIPQGYLTHKDLGKSVFVTIDITPTILKPVLGWLP